MARTKTNPTVVDVLVRLRSILRRGWVKGYYAKSKTGRMVEVDSKAAVGYCLTGARLKALGELDCQDRQQVRALIDKCIPGGFTPEAFNDSIATKKSDVIKVVTCAIEKAKGL